MFNFSKNIVVGVAVSPERGLEVAQIDYVNRVILKYGNRQLTYDNNRKEIADLDIFKETLSDLLFDMQIPKGSSIVLSLPTINFKITDYPGSLTETQVQSVVEEEVLEHPLLRETECSISTVRLPNSTMQFHKVAYMALQKTMLIEIAMQIKELGYKFHAIDTSVDTTLNSLIYNERVDIISGEPWLLLTIDNNYCRILSMQGNVYVDSYEERISIGEVLGDAENYATVSEAVNAMLKNLPGQRLYVLSKTDIISAKILAEKLTHNGQIIHHEANNFSTESFLNISDDVDPESAKLISLDVIGAAIYRDIKEFVSVQFNLYNSYLGDIYVLEQPYVLNLNSFSFTLSVENMLIASFAIAVPVIIIIMIVCGLINSDIKQIQENTDSIKAEIKTVQEFLDKYKDISTEVFNEAEEIQIGILHNKGIYSYYSIVGTEIPKKLWLTSLDLGKHTTIEGQADNLESVYSFFRNIKDYNPESKIKLQKLNLATKSKVSSLATDEEFDTDSIISSMEADFYSFRISDGPEETKQKNDKKDSNKKTSGIPNLEPLE